MQIFSRVMKIYFITIALVVMLASCNTYEAEQNQLWDQIHTRQTYIPKNDVEYDNYVKRIQLADDPTTILWCTFFPYTAGQEPFTVPIVGKLTSSHKRPYQDGDLQADRMFGDSSEYRFGFTPAGFYIDFTTLDSYCTNQPTTWQRNKTTLVMSPDKEFMDLQKKAKDALEAGNSDEALRLLESLQWEIGGQ